MGKVTVYINSLCLRPFSSVDVMDEAKKLIGTGNRHLVMGDVVSAVSVFQEACSMLWVPGVKEEPLTQQCKC